MSNGVTIYALIDPRDGAVKYVGQTKNLSHRIACHRRPDSNSRLRKWTEELTAAGRAFSAIALEYGVEPSAADEAERRHIMAHAATVLNKIPRDETRSVRYPGAPAKPPGEKYQAVTVRLHPDTAWRLQRLAQRLQSSQGEVVTALLEAADGEALQKIGALKRQKET